MKVGTDAMVLGAIVSAESPKRILDIGAGSGVLSLMMAQKFLNAEVVGVELDSNACRDCSSNFVASDWNDRLKIIHTDFLEYEPQFKFDLVLSNPPFFENSLKNDLALKSLARHNDSLPIEQLVERVSEILDREGSFWVILPNDQAEKLISVGKKNGLFPERIVELFGKPDRSTRKVIQLNFRDRSNVSTSSLIIRDSEGAYTEEYKQLTVDFHDRKL
jgi:tRNA1Val (adenine37-N6)-methyltransferase